MKQKGLVADAIKAVGVWPLYVFIWAIILWMLSPSVADADLWGHLRFGQDFLRWHALPQTDPYSYITAGTRWIDDEWLSEIIFALSYDRFRDAGLVGLKLVLDGSLIAILIWHLVRSRMPTLVALFLLWLSVALLCPSGEGLTEIRPQLFTFVLVAIELSVLDYVQRKGKVILLWSLPPLFAVWINLHGGVVAGLAIFVLWTSGRLVIAAVQRSSQAVNVQWFIALIASIVFCSITPFGADLLPFLIQAGSGPRPEVPEFHPLHLFSYDGALYLLLCGLSALVLHKRMLAMQPVQSLVLLACLFLPLKAVRHLPFAAIAFVVLCAPALALLLPKRSTVALILKGGHFGTLSRALLSCMLMAATGVIIYQTLLRSRSITVGANMPIRAVALLKQSGVTANLACWFDWGEYCIYELFPSVKVSIDGRRETIYSPAKYAENWRFMWGMNDWKDLLTKEPTNLVLANPKAASFSLMLMEPAWQLVYLDRAAALFARRGSNEGRLLRDAIPHVAAPSFAFP